MRRRSWLIVLGAFALLLVGDYAYWQVVSGQLRRGLDTWEVTLQSEGWEITSGPVVAGGWPLQARLTIPNVTLRHDPVTMPGAMDLAAPAVAVSVPLFQPTEVRLGVSSPLHLRSDTLPDLILIAQAMAGTAQLRKAGPVPFAFRARDLRLDPADGTWHSTVGLLTIDGTAADPGSDAAGAGQAATFNLAANTVALPSAMRRALGPNVSSLALQANLDGPLPRSRPVTQWAEAWRNGHGLLDISHFALNWGPLDLSGSAKLTLDDQLQPAGTANAHIVGYADTLDRLASAGLMTRSAATAAKAVLSLMSGDGNAASAIDVPLTLQSRTLSMRQLPLVRVPELDWPPAR